MSMESAAAFYEKLESDEALGARIQELGDKEKIAAYVRDGLGYDFTQEEMQKVVFERSPEMSDEELEAVVGGNGDTDMLAAILGSVTGVAVISTCSVAAAAVAAA